MLRIPIGKRTMPRLLAYAHNVSLRRIYGFTSTPRYGPILAYLEIERTCNLQCPMCLRRRLPLQQRTGQMDLETCKKVVDRLGSVLGVGLGGWGEPLLNPDIVPILQHISRKGLLIAFNTNGLLLKEYARDLANIKTLHHIAMSFDSVPSDEGRGHSSVEALEGFDALVKQKMVKGGKYPILMLRMTVMNCNVHDIPRIVKEAAKYGVTWFDTRDSMPLSEDNGEGLYGSPTASAYKKSLAEAVKVGRSLGVRVTYGRKDDNVSGIDYPERHYTPCDLIWKAPFIDFKGDVHPCCLHLNYPLGNATEKPLVSIWKSDAYKKLREKFLHAPLPYCIQIGCAPKSWGSPL